jgi:hypothetical protein
MEGTGKALDGSAFKEKTISRYKVSKKDGASCDVEIMITQNKKEERFIIISLPDFPMMKLRGIYSQQENVFHLISLEYLAGNAHGWNEYTIDLLGEAAAVSFENEAILSAINFEKVQISKGRIHRYDTRITGNEAIIALRNRRDRIIAVVDWMKSSQENTQEKLSIDEFEEYWKPILFPEMVSNRKRPALWLRENDTFEKSDNILWNKGYTERTFSEVLHPVRNSGTMLRDWEEALPWIYMEYNWDNIINVFTNEIIFTKIK